MLLFAAHFAISGGWLYVCTETLEPNNQRRLQGPQKYFFLNAHFLLRGVFAIWFLFAPQGGVAPTKV